MPASLNPRGVLGLVREVRASAEETRPVQVSGVLDEQLARELRAGGDPSFVRCGGDPATASVLVLVLAGEVTGAHEAVLRAADRAGTPAIAVQTGRDAGVDVPYVLATDVVTCPPGAGFPVAEIAAVVARLLGEDAAGLAARLPVLREPVSRGLVESFARRNGLLAAAIFVPGADFPILTLNQLRLVLRLAAAHGQQIDAHRAPELLAVVGGAVGFRRLAQLLGVVPVAGWAFQGAIAYGGTKTLGEAARQYFSSR